MPVVLPLSQIESVSLLREGVSRRQAEARAEAEVSRKVAAAEASRKANAAAEVSRRAPAPEASHLEATAEAKRKTATAAEARQRARDPPDATIAAPATRSRQDQSASFHRATSTSPDPLPCMTHCERASMVRMRQLDEALVATQAQRRQLERRLEPHLARKRDDIASITAGERPSEPFVQGRPPVRPPSTGVAALLAGDSYASSATEPANHDDVNSGGLPSSSRLARGVDEKLAVRPVNRVEANDSHGVQWRNLHHNSSGVAGALRGDEGGSFSTLTVQLGTQDGDIAEARARYADLCARPIRRDHQQSVVGEILRQDGLRENAIKPARRHEPRIPFTAADLEQSAPRQRAASARREPKDRWAHVAPRYLQPRPLSAGVPVRQAANAKVSRSQDLMHHRSGRLAAEREWQKAETRPPGTSRQALHRDNHLRLQGSPRSATELDGKHLVGRLLQARSVGGMGWAGDPC